MVLNVRLKETAGQTIQHARFRADLTTRQLAKKADVAEQTLVAIEQGHRRSPHGRTVYRIASALDIDATELFDGSTARAAS